MMISRKPPIIILLRVHATCLIARWLLMDVSFPGSGHLLYSSYYKSPTSLCYCLAQVPSEHHRL